jgi:hypothetical protein
MPTQLFVGPNAPSGKKTIVLGCWLAIGAAYSSARRLATPTGRSSRRRHEPRPIVHPRINTREERIRNGRLC